MSPGAWGQDIAAPPQVTGVPDALTRNWEVLRAMGGTRSEQDLRGCAVSLADHGPCRLSPDTAGRAEEQCVSLSQPVPGQGLVHTARDTPPRTC